LFVQAWPPPAERRYCSPHKRSRASTSSLAQATRTSRASRSRCVASRASRSFPTKRRVRPSRDGTARDGGAGRAAGIGTRARARSAAESSAATRGGPEGGLLSAVDQRAVVSRQRRSGSLRWAAAPAPGAAATGRPLDQSAMVCLRGARCTPLAGVQGFHDDVAECPPRRGKGDPPVAATPLLRYRVAGKAPLSLPSIQDDERAVRRAGRAPHEGLEEAGLVAPDHDQSRKGRHADGDSKENAMCAALVTRGKHWLRPVPKSVANRPLPRSSPAGGGPEVRG